MRSEYRAIGSYGTLGIEIVLSVLFGAYGGYWLDQKLSTGPVLQILGFFFGLAAAGKAVHRTWKEMQRDTAREEREQGNPAPRFEKPTNGERGSPPRDDAPMTRDDDNARS